MTCPYCSLPTTHYGARCPQCDTIFRAGERSGKNHAIKEIRQELKQLIRKMEAMEIK